MVQEPVDGGGGQGLGHDRVEAGWVQVGCNGDGSAFVGGVDDAVERFAGGLSGGEHADVIDDDELGTGDPGDGAGHGSVHGRFPDRGGEGLQGEPGDSHAGVDDLVGEGFDEVGLPGPGWSCDGEVLGSGDPGIVTNNGQVVARVQERFIPSADADHTAIVRLVRERLRPISKPSTAPAGAARSRAELHAAIVHQPERRAGGKGGVGI